MQKIEIGVEYFYMVHLDLMEAFGRGLLSEEQAKARGIATSNINTNGDAGPFQEIFVRFNSLLDASNHSPAARRRASHDSGLVSTFGRKGHDLYELWLNNRPL